MSITRITEITSEQLRAADGARIRVTLKGSKPLLMASWSDDLKKEFEEKKGDLPNVDEFDPEMTEQILALVASLKAHRQQYASDCSEKDLPEDIRLKIEGIRNELNALKHKRNLAYCQRLLSTNEDGVIGFKRDVLFACLTGAGRGHKLEGKSMMATAAESRLGVFLEIEEDFIPLSNQTWKPDFRMGKKKVGRRKKPEPIVRPRFDDWSLTFTIVFDRHLIPSLSMKALRTLFDDAGANHGLGAFRPGLSSRLRYKAKKEREKAQQAFEAAKKKGRAQGKSVKDFGYATFPPGAFGWFTVSEWEVLEKLTERPNRKSA